VSESRNTLLLDILWFVLIYLLIDLCELWAELQKNLEYLF
jgi:hypothetical protein